MERSADRDIHRERGARAGTLARVGLACSLAFGAVVGIGASTLPGVAAQGTSSLPDSAELVPEDALVYLSTNLEIDNDQWAQTQDLLTRIGFPDALPQLRGEILDEAGLVDGDVPSDDPLFGGELAVVVTEGAIARIMDEVESMGGMDMVVSDAMGDAETSAMATPGLLDADAATPVADAADAPALGVAAILFPGDIDEAWDTLQGLKEDMGGATSSTIDYEGVEIEYQPADPGAGSGTALARLDDAILVSGSAADLEPIIDVANGDAPAIAELDALNNVRDRLPAEALLFAYINGARIGDALPPEVMDALVTTAPQYAGMGGAIFDFDSGMTLSADASGFRFDAIGIAPEDSPMLAMLPENVDLTADERVAADTFVFAAGTDLGPTGALNSVAVSIAQLVNQAAGGAAATPMPTDPFAAFNAEYVEEQFAGAEDVLGFDLRADLFDQFVGEFAFALSLPSFGAGGLDFNGVFASGLDDEETVANSLTRLARLIDTAVSGSDIADIDVTTRQLDGDRVYVLQDPENPEIFSAEFGVVGEEVLAGIGSGINDYVTRPASPLADDPRYLAVMESLPADNYQAAYINIGQIVSFLEMTGVVEGGAAAATTDADPACADYATQASAQEAYDADPFEEAALDQDFDGNACEDFFADATPTAGVAGGSLSAIEAFAAVNYRTDDPGVVGSSAILFIGGAEDDS